MYPTGSNSVTDRQVYTEKEIIGERGMHGFRNLIREWLINIFKGENIKQKWARWGGQAGSALPVYTDTVASRPGTLRTGSPRAMASIGRA